MTNITSTLSGYFKHVYADKVEDLRPKGNLITADVKFAKRKQQNGNTFHQPVTVSHEAGFTYATADSTAFSINSAVAAVHQDAQVTGTQMLLESRIAYEVAARGNGSPKAFGAVTSHIMQNAIEAFQKREELKALYGGTGSIWSSLGQVGSRTAGGGSTVQTFNMRSGHWAPGIWAGMENSRLHGYNDDGTGGLPSTTLTSTTVATVQSVDFANKQITLQGAVADLNSLAASAADTTGTFLYFEGAFNAEGNGIVEIASNSGTLQNINGVTYGLWQGNTYSCGGTALTFAKLLSGHDAAVGRGLAEDVNVYLNPSTWTNVMSDLAALRRYDGSYSRTQKNGAESIEFCGQFGTLKIKPHICVKEGMAVSLPVKRCKLIGATPMTFRVPGMEDEKFLYQLPSNAGYGVRLYSNWSPFITHPSRCTLFTFITNT